MRYIDADAFSEKMERKYCESCDKYQGIRCNRCSCGDWLDALYFEPTADVRENVRGEWLHKKITDDYHVTGQCSNCHERRRIDNFCPNCGAQMRGDNDD